MAESTTEAGGACDRPTGVPCRADLRVVLMGNFVSLLERKSDGSLWCGARQGTPAPFYVPWPHSRDEWQRLYDLDDGLTLRHWHYHRLVLEQHGDPDCMPEHPMLSPPRPGLSRTAFSASTEVPDLESLLRLCSP